MEYVLDVSKWRCGENGPNSLGEGHSALLNDEGFMCCLGQFAKQANIPDEVLIDLTSPVTLHFRQVRMGGIEANNPYDASFVGIGNVYFANTPLTTQLMEINDDPSTTYQDKIDLISKTLEENGHTLKVINGELNG